MPRQWARRPAATCYVSLRMDGKKLASPCNGDGGGPSKATAEGDVAGGGRCTVSNRTQRGGRRPAAAASKLHDDWLPRHFRADDEGQWEELNLLVLAELPPVQRCSRPAPKVVPRLPQTEGWIFLRRLPNPRMYILPHVQEFRAGLDSTWEDRLMKGIFGVRNALEAGDALSPFPTARWALGAQNAFGGRGRTASFSDGGGGHTGGNGSGGRERSAN